LALTNSVHFADFQTAFEDDNGSMDEGRRVVEQVLGPGRAHLYDQLLRLVIADFSYSQGISSCSGSDALVRLVVTDYLCRSRLPVGCRMRLLVALT